jgi:hypothetical protein
MKLSTSAKAVLGIVAAAGAYRLYQLWKASSQITYTPSGLKFKRDKKQFFIIVEMNIMNPTSTSIRLRGIKGNISWNNYVISGFTSGPTEIKEGVTKLQITFELNNINIVQAIAQAAINKKWPIFNIEMKTMLPLFSYTEKFDINTATYIKDIQDLIFRENP